MVAKFSRTDEKNKARAKASAGNTAAEDKAVNQVKNERDDSFGNTSQWSTNQEKWNKLRMRVKREKNAPFVGCSNIRMPTIETEIRKIKAAHHNVTFSLRPVVQVTASPSGDPKIAKKIEKYLDFLIMDAQGASLKQKVMIALDRTLEKGMYLLKPFWNRQITGRTVKYGVEDMSVQEAKFFFSKDRQQKELMNFLADRLDADESSLVLDQNAKAIGGAIRTLYKGESSVTVILQDVIKNHPDFGLRKPEDVYVPTTSGYNPQECQYIIDEFFLPLNTLKQNVKLKGWSSKGVDAIGGTSELNLKNIETLKDEREGIVRIQESAELVKIAERYGWFDLKGNGTLMKSVITIAPEFSILFRKIALPFLSGKYPYVKLFFELIDDRWFSHRGIPEIIEDIVKEIDVQHMQKIDSQTIRNSPMFLFRSGQVTPRAIRFKFGQGIPVEGFSPLDDTIKQFSMTNTNAEFSYKDEQQILESKIQNVLGQVDFTLQSQINRREPRTATEVASHTQSQQLMFSLDSSLMTDQISELWQWMYELFVLHGEDEVVFKYFGEDAPIKLRKEEIQGNYTVKVRGNSNNTNPIQRLQKAQAVLDSLGNQLAIQMGIVTPQNIFAAYKRFLEEMQVENIEELISQPPAPAPPPPQPIEPKIKPIELTDGEVAQVLQKHGIQPDVEKRKMNIRDERTGELHNRQMDLAGLIKEGEKGNDNGQ